MHHLSLYTHWEQIIISSKQFILRGVVGIYLFIYLMLILSKYFNYALYKIINIVY